MIKNWLKLIATMGVCAILQFVVTPKLLDLIEVIFC